jgi:hypothetical protein
MVNMEKGNTRGNISDPISTHGFINSYIHELRVLAKSPSGAPGGGRNREAKWIPPPGKLKMFNVDVTVSKT